VRQNCAPRSPRVNDIRHRAVTGRLLSSSDVTEHGEVAVPGATHGGLRVYRGVRVLGMHRSGTSQVAGAFASAGYFAGVDEQLMSGDRWNPPGYFENTAIVAANDAMLASLGATWWRPPAPDDVRTAVPRLAESCADVFAGAVATAGDRPLVLKDPRIGLLMPVWDEVCGPEWLDVLVVRHPLAVARSLSARDGMTIQSALALWEVYLTSIVRSLVGREVVILRFGRDGCKPTDVDELSDFFHRRGLPMPNLSAHVSDLVHFDGDDDELDQYATVNQRRLWAMLDPSVGVHEAFRAPEWATVDPATSRDLVNRSSREPVDVRRELTWLRQENEQLQRSIEAVLNSTSWRVTLPLRWLFGMRKHSELATTARRYWGGRTSVTGAHVHSGALPAEWRSRGAGDTTVCAVVHAYYADLLGEIVDRLLLCERLTDVVVTHPLHVPESDLAGPLELLRDAGVTVHAVRVENLGRDVWPFLQVLDIMLATRCHAFVKVHTKKTPHAGEGYGEQWRRELLEGLLPGHASVESIVSFIVNAPVPGFVAPAPRVVRASHRDKSRKYLRRLCRKAGIRSRFPILFPAGTMYWCARNWLEFLRDLQLRRDDFEPEPLALDGTMAHAIERLIGSFCTDRNAHIWQTRFLPGD